MLRLRIITAVVLLGVLLGALALGPAAFITVVALVFGAAVYEWLRLAQVGRAVAVGTGVALAIVLASLDIGGARLDDRMMFGLAAAACLIWLAIGVWLMRVESTGVLPLNSGLTVALGVVLLAAAWFALLALLRVGTLFLFSVLAVVWIADIAAYFAGRAFGRRKLAPRISPGKTWAGVGGAALAVIAAAVVAWFAAADAEIFTTHLLMRLPWWSAAVLCLLVALSVAGDLFESLLKRQAGVKESSGLLPGHGGVLDRIDALLPVLPAAVLVEALQQ